MTMKLSTTPLLALLALANVNDVNVNALDDTDSFHPHRVSYQDLVSADPSHREKLTTVLEQVGLFSITDIPGFAREKPETLQYLSDCLRATKEGARHTFPDGTLRQTLATVPGQALVNHDSEVCRKLEQASHAFRATTAEVLQTVGHVLGELTDHQTYLRDADGSTQYTLEQMIAHGQQLEHFHVYQKGAPNTADTATLDWHTDQGLLLLFSPGLLHLHLNRDMEIEPSRNDFFIQLADGTQTAVQFSLQDELVVMLGEGVQHLDHPTQFRSVPHALKVQPHGTRVWYGRMALPPPTALHPDNPQTTFGTLREAQIASFDRQLQDVTEEDCNLEAQHFCWHRCMNFTDVVSPTLCPNATQVVCANPERQLWTDDVHDMAFQLTCMEMTTDMDMDHDDEEEPHDESDGHTHTHDESDGHTHDEEDRMDGSGASGVGFGVVALTVHVAAILGGLF